jgi:N-acetylglucosaminyl-diphospho-decaprenol L-rhamnosyltransferase
LESLNLAGVSDAQIIIVNNGSTDGTREFLATRPNIRVIHNETNRGCGGAWSQGSRAANATWTVVLNNDVLVPPGCFENLKRFAERNKVDVVSPAMCEGECDYHWQSYAAEFMAKMKTVRRRQFAHGVCFMVHRRVFETVGYFDEDLRLGGYEDDEFFRRAMRAGFKLAMTGSAFLHHFGSVTQKSMKSEQVMSRVFERRAYYRKKSGQTWIKRKLVHVRNSIRGNWWRGSEKMRFGHTLKERRLEGRWEFY